MSEDTYGTVRIARLCQVSPATVARWISSGLLPSFRTAGGHRRVWRRDVVAFLERLNLPVPENLAAARTALVVDDEEGVRRGVRRLLERLDGGWRVEEARSGFEAGSLAARLKPSLVVLDLLMPGLDGFAVIEALRADPSLKGVRILAISGHEPDLASKRALEAGADAFLAKPFDLDEVAGAVRRLLA